MDYKNLQTQDLFGMPDPLASNEEKLSPQYGIKVATSIQHEWFNGGMIDKHSLFHGRHQWIREMRLYNRGEQDVQPYKDHVARQQEDLAYLNLDWTPINICEKFTNIVRNGISDDYYRVELRSADKFAMLQKKEAYDRHKVNMATKSMLEQAKKILGIDLTEKGFIPEDEDEIELYNDIKERPKQEIAEEILIDFVKKTNRWDHIKKESDKDLVLCDLQVARVITDKNNGVMVKDVDIEAYGHSFVEKNDFDDAFYHFEVETMTINQLRRESGFTDVECRKIAMKYGNSISANVLPFGSNYSTCPIEQLLNFRIHVMHFCYKSDKEIVMKKYHDKKNRVKKVAMRDGNYEVPEGHEQSRMSKRLDTWYEGSYVVGSNEFIYNYKECEILARDEMNKVLPPFIAQSTNLYKNTLKSFLSNIIPICDQLQYTHLKIQHLQAELKPDLIVLDLDQLAELNTNAKGEIKGDTWKTALSLLNVKGVAITKRTNMGEDGIKDTPAARPMATQQGSALTALLNIWAHYYNTLRDITGVNPAVDGSVGDNSLVGVNQMKQLAFNTATKHLVDASVMFDKRICETISSRIKGIFKVKGLEHLRPMYEQAVGKHNIDALSMLKNRHIHEFGFTVEMLPAKEEMDELKADLNIALQEGTIDVSEKSEVIRMARSNPKQAGQYMRFIRKRRIKQKLEETRYNQELQSQSNAQAAQAKAQAETIAYQQKKMIDLQFEAKKSAIAIQEKAQMIQLEAPGKELEFRQDVYIESLKNAQVINLAKFKEDAKDKRLDVQSSHQSELIDQRSKDKEPKDFTAKFDIEQLFQNAG